MTDAEVAALAAELLELIESGDVRFQHRRNALKQELAEEFGRRRGWKLSQRWFCLSQLGRRSNQTKAGELVWADPHHLVDHAYSYRDVGRPYRPAALAAHLYDWPYVRDAVVAVCGRYGLSALVVDDFPSWWFPGRTTLIVYRPQIAPSPSNRRLM